MVESGDIAVKMHDLNVFSLKDQLNLTYSSQSSLTPYFVKILRNNKGKKLSLFLKSQSHSILFWQGHAKII